MSLPELIANSPTPGRSVAITTLASGQSSTTSLTFSMAGAAPAALQAVGSGQFRAVIDSEIIVFDATQVSTDTWTALTRGAEGSTKATHLSGASVYHYLTAGALAAGYAQVGTDGTVGGPGGTDLTGSVVSASSSGGIPAWVTGTVYAINVLVSNGGTNYICNTANTAGATFAGDAAKWTALGAAGGVTTFNTRSGAVTLAKADVTGTGLAASDVAALPTAGGTMSGAIAMGSHKVTGLTNGSAASDAAAYGQIPNLGVSVSAQEAVADAKTYWNGVMSSSSAVLTDTTNAPFTAGDVGKVIVVNNALGQSSHLYTTIASYQSASQVTLTASATTAQNPALYTYGTDDTAAWNAAIALLTPGASLLVPSSPSLVTSAIAVNTPCRVFGQSVSPTPYSQVTQSNIPVVAPFLLGSVLVQAGANQHGFTSTLSREALDFENVGVYFAGMFASTGNGFNIDPGTGVSGLFGAKWNRVEVYGASPTEYAVYIRNPLLCQFDMVQTYACGGGFHAHQDATNYTTGNCGLTNLYCCQQGGSLAGIYLTGGINLLTFVRPQSCGIGSIGSIFSPWGSAISGWTGFSIDSSGADAVCLVAPDLEGATALANIGPTTEFVYGGNVVGVSGIKDSAPFQRLIGSRRVNADGSFSLDNHETSGSALWLMRDNVNSSLWSINTDGTNTFNWPGRINISGSGPTAPTPGSAMGTGMLQPRISGSDLAGSVIFSTGASPGTGTLMTATFATAYAGAPPMVITPLNAATQALGLYVVPTTTGFTVGCATAPSASQFYAYEFSYFVPAGSGLAVPPVIYDSFVRANSSMSLGTADSGAAWVVQSGGPFGISSNSAYVTVSAASIATQNVGYANYQVDCDMTTIDNSAGIVVRCSNGSNAILCDTSSVYTLIAGAYTQVATYTAFANGDHMTAVCNGTSISVEKNGSQVASVTSSFNETATLVGIRLDVATSRLNNFAAG